MTTASDIIQVLSRGLTSCEINGDNKNIIEEPLLKGNPNRHVLFPIKDEDVSTVCVYNQRESHLNNSLLS